MILPVEAWMDIRRYKPLRDAGATWREIADEVGLDWRYVHLPIAPELFAETVRALPVSGYRGANVTIPHKLAAHDVADELTPAAAAIGAVNTLTFESQGRIVGDNTDAGGFLDAVGMDPAGRQALVLGAGGAARAVV